MATYTDMLINFTFPLGRENIPENVRRILEMPNVEKRKARADRLDWVNGDENVGMKVTGKTFKGTPEAP